MCNTRKGKQMQNPFNYQTPDAANLPTLDSETKPI